MKGENTQTQVLLGFKYYVTPTPYPDRGSTEDPRHIPDGHDCHHLHSNTVKYGHIWPNRLYPGTTSAYKKIDLIPLGLPPFRWTSIALGSSTRHTNKTMDF